VPSHAGTHPSITPVVETEIRALRRQHPRWSYQLVHDNLAAIGRLKPELGVLPGYATVCRFMKHQNPEVSVETSASCAPIAAVSASGADTRALAWASRSARHARRVRATIVRLIFSLIFCTRSRPARSDGARGGVNRAVRSGRPGSRARAA